MASEPECEHEWTTQTEMRGGHVVRRIKFCMYCCARKNLTVPFITDKPKDERQPPNGYGIAECPDLTWEWYAVPSDGDTADVDTRDDAIDACERHLNETVRSVIAAFDKRVGQYLSERDEARAEVERLTKESQAQQQQIEFLCNDTRHWQREAESWKHVAEKQTEALKELGGKVESYRSERDKARAMVTAEHEAMFTEVERLKARVAELEGALTDAEPYVSQYGDDVGLAPSHAGGCSPGATDCDGDCADYGYWRKARARVRKALGMAVIG